MLTRLKALFTSKGNSGSEAQTETIRIVTIGPSSSGKTSFWQKLLQEDSTRPRLPLHLELELDEHALIFTQPDLPAATMDEVVVFRGNVRHGNVGRSLEIVDINGGLVRETENKLRERLNELVKEAHLVLFFLPPEVLEPGNETRYREVILRYIQLMDIALDHPPKSVNKALSYIGICFTKADEYGFMPLPDPRAMHNTKSSTLFHQICRKNDVSDDALTRFMQSLTFAQGKETSGADVNHIMRHSRGLWSRAIERGHRYINAYWIATGASSYDNRYDNWYSRGAHYLISDFAEHLRLFFPYKAPAGFHATIGYRYRIGLLAIVFGACVWTAIVTVSLIGERSSVKTFERNNIANYPPIKYNTEDLDLTKLKSNNKIIKALSLEEVNTKLAAYAKLVSHANTDKHTQDPWEAINARNFEYPSEITKRFVAVLKSRTDAYQKFSQLTAVTSSPVDAHLFAEFTAYYIQDHSDMRFKNYLAGYSKHAPIGDVRIENELKNTEKKNKLREAARAYFNDGNLTGDALSVYLKAVGKFDLHAVPKTCMSPSYLPNVEKKLLATEIRSVDMVFKKDEVFLIQLQPVFASKAPQSLALIWQTPPHTEEIDVLLERNITSGNMLKSWSVPSPGFSIALDNWRITSVGFVSNYASVEEDRSKLIKLSVANDEAPSLEKMLNVSLTENGNCILENNHANVVRLLRPVAAKLLGSDV